MFRLGFGRRAVCGRNASMRFDFCIMWTDETRIVALMRTKIWTSVDRPLLVGKFQGQFNTYL